MKYSAEDLVRYADNRLKDDRKLIEAAENDKELAETLAALDTSKLPYKAAFDKQQPPMPDQLRADMLGLISKAKSGDVAADTVVSMESQRGSYQFSKRRAWTTPLTQAACLALSVGAGFLLGNNWDQSSVTSTSEHPVASIQGESTGTEKDEQLSWVERVADYQTLYVPNTVKGIQLDMPATIEKLEQLAQSSGVQSAIPDLTEAGYQFARAQELGYNGETLVQLVYSKDGHTPLALCFMPADGALDEPLKIGERHGLGTASWVDNNQRFVIVAKEGADTLKSLFSTASTAFDAG